MSDFRANLNEMGTKAETLRGYAEQYNNVVKELAQTGEALNGMWEGDAHDQFLKEFRSDKLQMDEFYKLVIEYVNMLLVIQKKYIAAENHNLALAQTRSYR